MSLSGQSRKEPPRAALLVMGGVCILLGMRPTFQEARKAILDPRFVSRLGEVKHYDLDRATIERLRRFREQPEYTLTSIAKTRNNALLALAQYSLAVHDACHGFHLAEEHARQQAAAHAEAAAAKVL